MLGNLLKQYSDAENNVSPKSAQFDKNSHLNHNDFDYEVGDQEIDFFIALPPDPQVEVRRLRVLDILNANPSITRAMIDDHESDPLNVILTLAIRNIGTVELLIPKKSFNGMAILNSLESLQMVH